MALRVEREVLAKFLRTYAEDDLAERALSASDGELARIGTLAAYYAFSEDAMVLGGGMGGARALAVAAIDVLEASGRDLRRHRSEQELLLGMSKEPEPDERFRDRELRRHAAERQEPADC